MPWKCPACQTQIAHDGDVPERKRVYRCHVCRLELVFDETLQQLTVAPLLMLRRETDPPAANDTLPPCPKCRGLTGIEEDESRGRWLRLFACRLCGHRWSVAPKAR